MPRFVPALVWVFACTASVTLGPPIDCTGVKIVSNNGECDLVPTGACNDGHFYEVNCGDDSTCTCAIDGQLQTPVIASGKTSGFCATLTVAMMHDIAAQCTDPSHPGDNLNIVPTP